MNKLWWFSAFVFAFAASVNADELTLSQALHEALEHNSGYHASRNDVKVAAGIRDSAWGGYLPVVTSNASYGRSWLDTYDRNSSGTVDEHGLPAASRTAGVNMDWTLFSGFSTPYGQKRLRLLFEQAQDNAELARESLVSRVVLGYADLARQSRLYKALDTSADISQERIRILERSLALGAASHSDWLTEKVDLDADLAALHRQRAALRSAQVLLGQILGRNKPVTEDVDSIVVSDASLDLESLLQGLPEHRPDLKLVQSNTDLAKVSAQQRATQWLPRLDALAGYNFVRNSAYGDAAFGGPTLARTLGPSVGLQLNFNIFTGEFPWSTYRRARVALTSIELRQQEALTSAEAEVRQDHATFHAADSALSLEKEALGYAQENLGLTFLRWKSGSISYLDARTAQNQYLTTFTLAENTAFDALSERLELLIAAGQLESIMDSTQTNSPAR